MLCAENIFGVKNILENFSFIYYVDMPVFLLYLNHHFV